MIDAPSTTTPAPATSTPAPDYRSSFPNSPTMFEAPAPRPADPAEITYRQAFPSMFQRQPEHTTPDPAEGTMYRAAVKRGAPQDAATPPSPTGEAAPGSQAAPAPTAGEPAGIPVDLTASGLAVMLPTALHLDAADLKAFDSAAKDLGLDAPAAQRLLDMHAQGQASLTAAADAAFSETVAGWREAVAKDPEVGGARFKETVAEARQTIERFGSPALREILNQSGLGSHPEVVRFVHRVGRALAAAEARGAQAAGPEPERDYSTAFPSMHQK